MPGFRSQESKARTCGSIRPARKRGENLLGDAEKRLIRLDTKGSQQTNESSGEAEGAESAVAGNLSGYIGCFAEFLERKSFVPFCRLVAKFVTVVIFFCHLGGQAEERPKWTCPLRAPSDGGFTVSGWSGLVKLDPKGMRVMIDSKILRLSPLLYEVLESVVLGDLLDWASFSEIQRRLSRAKIESEDPSYLNVVVYRLRLALARRFGPGVAGWVRTLDRRGFAFLPTETNGAGNSPARVETEHADGGVRFDDQLKLLFLGSRPVDLGPMEVFIVEFLAKLECKPKTRTEVVNFLRMTLGSNLSNPKNLAAYIYRINRKFEKETGQALVLPRYGGPIFLNQKMFRSCSEISARQAA